MSKVWTSSKAFCLLDWIELTYKVLTYFVKIFSGDPNKVPVKGMGQGDFSAEYILPDLPVYHWVRIVKTNKNIIVSTGEVNTLLSTRVLGPAGRIYAERHGA